MPRDGINSDKYESCNSLWVFFSSLSHYNFPQKICTKKMYKIHTGREKTQSNDVFQLGKINFFNHAGNND